MSSGQVKKFNYNVTNKNIHNYFLVLRLKISMHCEMLFYQVSSKDLIDSSASNVQILDK